MNRKLKLNLVSVVALSVFVFFAFGSKEPDDSYESHGAGSGPTYERTSPGYDANAPLTPRYKADVEPLYNEVERRKKDQGISDREAVNQIVDEYERSKGN